MRVNICGVPHEIVYCESNFDTDLHIGQIDYGDATIRINSLLHPQIIKV